MRGWRRRRAARRHRVGGARLRRSRSSPRRRRHRSRPSTRPAHRTPRRRRCSPAGATSARSAGSRRSRSWTRTNATVTCRCSFGASRCSSRDAAPPGGVAPPLATDASDATIGGRSAGGGRGAAPRQIQSSAHGPAVAVGSGRAAVAPSTRTSPGRALDSRRTVRDTVGPVTNSGRCGPSPTTSSTGPVATPTDIVRRTGRAGCQRHHPAQRLQHPDRSIDGAAGVAVTEEGDEQRVATEEHDVATEPE